MRLLPGDYEATGLDVIPERAALADTSGLYRVSRATTARYSELVPTLCARRAI